MLKRDITYEDFNGLTVTETFYFNLSVDELMEIEVDYPEGVEGVFNSGDRKKIFQIIRRMILGSYGIKSEDGKDFLKSKKLLKKFKNSNAYDMLYVELGTNADKAAEFFNGITSSGFAKFMKTVQTTDVELPPVKE